MSYDIKNLFGLGSAAEIHGAEEDGQITPQRMVERAAEEMGELRADPSNVTEAADVVICLARFPGLWAEIERKMVINRKRRWRLMGDGTGYHIKATE